MCPFIIIVGVWLEATVTGASLISCFSVPVNKGPTPCVEVCIVFPLIDGHVESSPPLKSLKSCNKRPRWRAWPVIASVNRACADIYSKTDSLADQFYGDVKAICRGNCDLFPYSCRSEIASISISECFSADDNSCCDNSMFWLKLIQRVWNIVQRHVRKLIYLELVFV